MAISLCKTIFRMYGIRSPKNGRVTKNPNPKTERVEVSLAGPPGYSCIVYVYNKSYLPHMFSQFIRIFFENGQENY